MCVVHFLQRPKHKVCTVDLSLVSIAVYLKLLFPCCLCVGEEGSKTKKKRVSWAEDSNLVVMHYFEMDESERGDCMLQHKHTAIAY